MSNDKLPTPSTHGSPELDADAAKLEAMGADPGPTWDSLAFDLLVDLRGRFPGKCDFCQEPYSPDRDPVPEEAGEWACSVCVDRWRKEDVSGK